VQVCACVYVCICVCDECVLACVCTCINALPMLIHLHLPLCNVLHLCASAACHIRPDMCTRFYRRFYSYVAQSPLSDTYEAKQRPSLPHPHCHRPKYANPNELKTLFLFQSISFFPSMTCTHTPGTRKREAVSACNAVKSCAQRRAQRQPELQKRHEKSCDARSYPMLTTQDMLIPSS